MKNVMASATEAEIGAIYHDAKDGVMIRQVLIEMGHPQPPTPIQTDKANAAGISNNTIKQRKSKAMDMRFYWIQDRTGQGQFAIYWERGQGNLADYYTKHHPPSHHIAVRPTYLQTSQLAMQPQPSEGEGVLILDSGLNQSPATRDPSPTESTDPIPLTDSPRIATAQPSTNGTQMVERAWPAWRG